MNLRQLSLVLVGILLLAGCGKKEAKAEPKPVDAVGGELNPAPKPSADFLAAKSVPATTDGVAGWWKSEKLEGVFYDLNLFHLPQGNIVSLSNSKYLSYRPSPTWEIGKDGNVHFRQHTGPNAPKDGAHGTAKLQEDGTLRIFMTYLPDGKKTADWVLIDGTFTLKRKQ